MPLYEYRCNKCEKKFEVIRKFSDPPLTEHEGCGGSVEQMLSAPAFQLKGTGWYVTDYAKAGAKPASDSGSKSGESESKTSESKGSDGKAADTKTSDKPASESKSETKTETKPAASTTKSD